MTVVLPSDAKVDTASPGTHVLIIGVGGYPHLLGGDPEGLTDDPMGLAQLTSPPVSANAVAGWFLGQRSDPKAKHGFNNPKAPLASIEMLVSPSWVLEERQQPHKFRLADGAEIKIDRATRERIRSCYAIWHERVKANPSNVGVLYFCGHGVTGLNDYVLPEDFGKDRKNPWHDGIDIATTARAARRSIAGALYFFIDACRETKQDALMPGAQAQPLEYVNFKKPVQCFARVMLWATGEGRPAHGPEGKPSRFASALIHALSGFCGESSPDGPAWAISGAVLADQVDSILKEENKSLAPHLEQNIEAEIIGSRPFHFEMERPQTVVTKVSIAHVYPQLRERLDALPAAKTLPPMVKEAIAERVESGRMPLGELQGEVERWSEDIAAWTDRFATEPDREVAEEANALLVAGKLDHAGVLLDGLIRASEARAEAENLRRANYYWGRGNVLMLQSKWRNAVPFLEKAFTTVKQIFGDTPHADVADSAQLLGLAWRRLGEYHKAIGCYNEALAIDQRIHSDKPHRNVAAHLNNLAVAWTGLEEYHKAIGYLTQALAINKKLYGDTPHNDVACVLASLGTAWSGLREHQRAIDYFTQALAIDQKVYGDTPVVSVASTLNNLGLTWQRVGEYKKAIESLTQALTIDQTLYGETPHPDLAIRFHNLGLAWQAAGEPQKAIDYFSQALTMDQKLYGEAPHSHVASDLHNLGRAWNNLSEHGKALEYLCKALALNQKIYGDTPDAAVASTLNELGLTWVKLGEYEKAIDYFSHALAIDQKIHGDKPHCNLATRLNNLGGAWLFLAAKKARGLPLEKYDKAIDYLTQASVMLEAILPADHSDVQTTRDLLQTTRYLLWLAVYKRQKETQCALD
jgi:tetratricopeptide (TPR) repeat protein